MGTKFDAAVDLIRGAVHGLVAVYVYGSMAAGNSNNRSDCDLAVLAENPVDTKFLWNLRGDLEETLACEVDLVDLRSVHSVLAIQIVAYGTTLFGAESVAREQFENLVFSSYARLNEERAGILSDVMHRGSIYG